MAKFLFNKKNDFTATLEQSLAEGFTIIELMIAAFVLTVGIVGAYVAISGPIRYTKDSMNKITATYLAQEGIEIVRNIRDANWLQSPGDWSNGLMFCSVGCEAVYNSSSLTTVSGDLQKFKKNDFYNYISGTDTIFSRKIIIKDGNTTDCPSGICLQIKSTVYWAAKEITVAENLYNWYEP